MATGPGYPSPTSVFIPNWEASGRLAVNFSRNPADFPIMQYCELRETKKIEGKYLKFSPQEAARVVDMNDYRWARNQTSPERPDGMEQFNFVTFSTERFRYGFNIDDDTDQMAEWPIVEQHSLIHAAKAMTARTIRVLGVLGTAANWQTSADPDMIANHTATATALAGGKLDVGTSTAPYLKKAIDKMSIAIDLDTLGTVKPNTMMVLMNPNTAALISESPEIHEYLAHSRFAMDEIRNGSSPNAKYGLGLPSQLYNFPVIVDNTVKVTSRKGATLAKSYAFPDQTVAMVSRIGAMVGPSTGPFPSWSTLTIFWHRDEMTVERFHEPRHRLSYCYVTEDTAEILTSPLSGYLLTAATA